MHDYNNYYVRCARANGVAMLGVATGLTSSKELRAAGADYVLETLEHKDDVLQILFQHNK